jgi:FKBP-type peptidyl-prolyl cis-trans isomerase FklB
MKRLFYYLALPAALLLGTACADDDNTVDYSDYYKWKDRNNELFSNMGEYYETTAIDAYFDHRVASQANPGCYNYYRVIRQADEEALRAANKWYTPYYTSTLKVHYTLYDTESVLDLLPTDAASFNNPAVMDSIFFDSSTKADTLQSYQVQFYDSFSCASVIEGWADILQQMHIGDTWLVAIPWQAGYGQAGSTSGGTIDPYSSLFFRIQLCDITWWGGTLETSY